MNQLICIIACALLPLSAAGQGLSSYSFLSDSIRSYTLEFLEINNLVVVPASFNGSDTLYFILDTGAENMILFGAEFDTPPLDTTQLRKVKVAGAGDDELISAFVSPVNDISIGPILGTNINVIYVPDDRIKLSDLLGHSVHGIIGARIFHDFVVKLNYYDRKVTFIDHEHFKPRRRFSKVPVYLEGLRPFIDVMIEIHPRITMTSNLLVDLGESKPISLFLSTNEAFILPYPNYYANLGKGLSGMVTGRVARVSSVTLDKYILRNVITAFPDQDAIQYLTSSESRNGSLGAGILRRFVTIFDLRNEMIYLKRSSILRQRFSFDRTGLIIVAEGDAFDHFRISGIIPGSPADGSGLLMNDRIREVNGIPIEGMKLGEVLHIIEEGGRKLRFKVDRKEQTLQFSFKVYRLL